MTPFLRARRLVLAVTLLVALTAPAALAQSAGPKPITLDDYAGFKRISGAAVSTDGKWMLYTVAPNEGDATLVVKSLDTDKTYEVVRGTGASFSENARWVAYFISPPSESSRGGRGTAPRERSAEAPAASAGSAAQQARTFELLDLRTGNKTTMPSVASFECSPDGEWLLVRPQAPGAASAPTPAAGRGGRGGAAAGQRPPRAGPVRLRTCCFATSRQATSDLSTRWLVAFDESGKCSPTRSGGLTGLETAST